jgi:hypothetical protein
MEIWSQDRDGRHCCRFEAWIHLSEAFAGAPSGIRFPSRTTRQIYLSRTSDGDLENYKDGSDWFKVDSSVALDGGSIWIS